MTMILRSLIWKSIKMINWVSYSRSLEHPRKKIWNSSRVIKQNNIWSFSSHASQLICRRSIQEQTLKGFSFFKKCFVLISDLLSPFVCFWPYERCLLHFLSFFWTESTKGAPRRIWNKRKVETISFTKTKVAPTMMILMIFKKAIQELLANLVISYH